jgi:cytochrome c553
VHGTIEPVPSSALARRSAVPLMLLALLSLFAAQSVFAQSGSVEAGREKSVTCAACHGADGNSVTAEWPSLAGQHAQYTARQLRAFQTGDRVEVSMTAFASMLSDQDIADLAAFYEAQTPMPRGADPEHVAVGEMIYRGGVAERGVAACIACHGPRGQGNPLSAWPVVSGQHATYTFNTLRQYAAGERRSDQAMAQVMREIAVALREDEMRALAGYLQGLR